MRLFPRLFLALVFAVAWLSPAAAQRVALVVGNSDYKLISRLGAFTVNVFRGGEPAGYPTLCKGRFITGGRASYLFEEPASLNVIDMLPRLMAAGVTALKIEGRQRGRAYVAQVVAAFRQAVDAASRGEPAPRPDLAGLTEGLRDTSGVYAKTWQ